MSDMRQPANPDIGFGVRFEPKPLPDPSEPIQVTMPREHWADLLDHLNAELAPKIENETATDVEINIVVRLACALIDAGRGRAEHAMVEALLKGGAQ